MSKIKSVFIGGVVGLMTCCTGCESKQKEYQNWEIYGGTKDNIRSFFSLYACPSDFGQFFNASRNEIV